MRKSKTPVIVAGIVAIAALAALAYFLLGNPGGDQPSKTEAYEGGEWITGASAGRAWSQYSHPDEWHRAGVKGAEEAWSECVAPGEIANAQAPQPKLGKSEFFAEFCDPAEAR